jgi:hypothetical protein
MRAASDSLIEFRTDVMYDGLLSRWTYKVWEIMQSSDVEGEPWRLREYWCDCDEDGTYRGIGDVYEPKYFKFLVAALSAMQVEVESYI